MEDPPKKRAVTALAALPNWMPIGPTAMRAILAHSQEPEMVHPLSSEYLPVGLKSLPGVHEYYVSSYAEPLVICETLTGGGEFTVSRIEGDVRKNYNFIFATSEDGHVYFNGPYKDFAAHHARVTEPVIYVTLFNHTPFNK